MADVAGPHTSPALLGPTDPRTALRTKIGRLLGHPRKPPALARRRRTVAYARFSSEGQKESSIERQLELAREYAVRHDLDLVDTYEDRAVSGMSRVGRAALARLLADAGTGMFDLVFVEGIDRLARIESDAHAIMDELQYLKVELHDQTGVRRGLGFGIGAIVAAEEVRQTKARTRRGRRSAVQKGLSPHPPKFGYRLTNKRGALEPHPERVGFVREIVRRYASGISRASIARDLTGRAPTPGDCRAIDHGRAPPGLRSPWTSAMVREIIRGTVYLGVLYDGKSVTIRDRNNQKVGVGLRPEEDWVEGLAPHLRIVDDATWLRANARLADDVDTRGHASNRYLLAGLATCGLCGRRLALSYRHRRDATAFFCGAGS